MSATDPTVVPRPVIWRRRRSVIVLLVVGLVLLSTGCLQASARVVVHDEHTASVTIDILPDRQRWEDLGGEGRAAEVVSQAGQFVPVFQAEQIEGERAPGIRLTWDDAPISALTEPLTVNGRPVAPVFERFSVTRDGDAWELDAAVAPLAPFATLVGARFPGGSDSEVTVQLTVQMPGRVVRTNAADHDRSSATWSLDPHSTAAVPLDMRNEPGLGISPVVVLVAGLVVLILVGVVLVVWSDRSRVRRRLQRAAKDAVVERNQGATRPTGPAAAAPKRTRRRRRARQGGVPAAARTGAPPKGMYQDISGDESVALPVGGSAWGPAPPPQGESTAEDVVAADPVAAPDVPGGDGGGAPLLPPEYHGDAPPGGPAPVTDPQPVGPTEPASRAVLAEPTAPVEPAASPTAQVVAAAPAAVVAPPGWYPDPDDPDRSRFWDGSGWTEHRG